MNSICGCFIDGATKIKRWLAKQPEVKEETLTDWLLYNLSEESPAIRYKQFNRTEEGRKTGADWEWWFLFPNGRSFVARIQAKKLKHNSDCFPGIAYSKNNKLQIERLLDDSVANGAASFYVFYSVEDAKHTGCKEFGSHSDEGIFLAEANCLRNEVILKGRKVLFPKDLLVYTNPISCLFCCPSYVLAQNIEEGFRQYLGQYFPTYSENSSKESIEEVGFRQTPGYILQITTNEILSTEWETEYSSFFENVNAVLVIDLRDIKILSNHLSIDKSDSYLSYLYKSFFKCLYKHFPEDKELQMYIAKLEQDMISYILAIKGGAQFLISREELYERYSNMTLEMDCAKKREKLSLYLNK